MIAMPNTDPFIDRPEHVDTVFEIIESKAIVERIPPPRSNPEKPLRALVFDSHYDAYKGVVAYVRLMDGVMDGRTPLLVMSNGVRIEAIEVGIFNPSMTPVRALSAGEVGYVATGLKIVRDCSVGDTLTVARQPAEQPLRFESGGRMWWAISCISMMAILFHADATRRNRRIRKR